ncbi:hypothetical protein [Aliivibrio salmonicida]|uniref:hypothetical protein n=1 Tax=Aliivibrio salmonicida TaxID=40269 RepID=UPI003D14CB7C
MSITSLIQYKNALDKLLIFSEYLNFRNFSTSEAKKFNDLVDAIEIYEIKNGKF